MTRVRVVFLALVSLGVAACRQSADITPSAGGDPQLAQLSASRGPVQWTAIDVPTEAVITGGPWTLEQVGTSAAAPSAGYCLDGGQQPNPGTERMSPYYFPLTVGRGSQLQGYFDYRPKDIDEAIVAATSTDDGHAWTFQQEALELTQACPSSDATTLGNDDGQGHPYVLTVNGTTFLYTLDRTAGNVDSAGLSVHALAPTQGQPLAPTPSLFDVSQRTSGLLNPDAILARVPGVFPTTVLYLQKQLNADTVFPSAQQCPGAKANHDVTTVRLAQTDDGITFTDLGPVNGLNDSTDVSSTETRWIGPRGTIFGLSGGRYGLFFSGGTCLDNDSDAFHYIGYAESRDLQTWQVFYDISSPIASVSPVVAPDGTALPAVAPVTGNTQGWFAGRLYSPSGTLHDSHTVALSFAGYHSAKPKNAEGDYRGVGRVFLYANQFIDEWSWNEP